MKYSYEINKDNSVNISVVGEPQPFAYQPHYPNGESWNAAQAEAWAKQVILSLTDPLADLPGDDSANPTKPRPVVDEPIVTIEP